MSVLELGAAKRYLRMRDVVVDTDLDAELQAAIDSAEATIARRLVAPEADSLEAAVEVVERVAATGGTLVLTGRVLTLTTVAGVNPTGTVDVADLRVDTESRLITFSNGYGVFTSPTYDVTYQAGFDPLDFPPDLLNAIKELVRHRWKPQRGGAKARTGADQADGTYVDGIPKSVAVLLDQFEPVQGFA